MTGPGKAAPEKPGPGNQGPAKAGPERILILNAGSSSLKFALYGKGSEPGKICSGTLDRIGSAEATLAFHPRTGPKSVETGIAAREPGAILGLALSKLAPEARDIGFEAVGHRVVHGGMAYRVPALVDGRMLEELRALSPIDPEHLPAEIALMEAVAARFPAMPQVACFDTAFHRDLPRVAALLPIPRRYEALGLRRFGFHGLSYAYLMRELERIAGKEAAAGRVILAHLGNGASLAAVHEGRSRDTTMAFTPAAGLAMGTRSGDLDPGILSFLARKEGMTLSRFDRMANHESGLLGVSETSSDMRELLAREAADTRAAEAVDLFCYQVRKGIGAYAAALGGLDTLVFSGGIGENAAPVRARVCEGLGFLGIELDAARNGAHAPLISAAGGRVPVRVIPTDEAAQIARSAWELLDSPP
jgi:acetate kinase